MRSLFIHLYYITETMAHAYGSRNHRQIITQINWQVLKLKHPGDVPILITTP